MNPVIEFPIVCKSKDQKEWYYIPNANSCLKISKTEVKVESYKTTTTTILDNIIKNPDDFVRLEKNELINYLNYTVGIITALID